MFLEVILPALCAVVLAAWVSKPDNEALFARWNPAVYVAAIIIFLRSPWGERDSPKGDQGNLEPIDETRITIKCAYCQKSVEVISVTAKRHYVDEWPYENWP